MKVVGVFVRFQCRFTPVPPCCAVNVWITETAIRSNRVPGPPALPSSTINHHPTRTQICKKCRTPLYILDRPLGGRGSLNVEPQIQRPTPQMDGVHFTTLRLSFPLYTTAFVISLVPTMWIVSLSSFAYLELVQYHQNRVDSIDFGI
jgi:hypothetical protein